MNGLGGGDALLARALLEQTPGASDTLFERHFDRLYGLLRMLLPGQAPAARLATETIAIAVEQPQRLNSEGASSLAEWLAAEALMQLPPLSAPSTAVPRACASRAAIADALETASDETVRVLVRSLDPARRRAVVLSALLGYPHGFVAAVLGVSEGDVALLVDAGLDDLCVLLERHEVRERARTRTRSGPALALKPAPHLRPLPYKGGGGIIVVRGDKAYVDRGPESNLLLMAYRAIERFLARLNRQNLEDELDDEVGGPGKGGKAPDPTPTLQPFKRPKNTPSIPEYRKPEATRGTASHRSPQPTPSMARISSRTRPLTGGVHAARAKRW